MKAIKLQLFFVLIISFSIIFQSCTAFNQAATPGTKIIKSDFDGSVDVLQSPVSSSSSLSEGWHTLGFRWNSNLPDKVFLTVGVHGINNVTGLSFNIDGEIFDIEVASSITDYGDWSTRQFVTEWSLFKKLANANDVKMKVVMIDKYSVSSFGKLKPEAIVSGKFSEFLKEAEARKKN